MSDLLKLRESFFYIHCKDFFEFYKSLYPKINVEPNFSHHFLAEMEKSKKLTIITQNIDGLHEKAGSQNVINLHGTVIRNHCVLCRKSYSQQEMNELLNMYEKGVPKCPHCKIGVVRPNIVLYDEMIPIKSFLDAKRAVKEADIIIVDGTTLFANPIKNLIANYTGKMVIINQEETSADNKTDLIFNEEISKVLRDLDIQDVRYNQ